jgi:hypothetical protein
MSPMHSGCDMIFLIHYNFFQKATLLPEFVFSRHEFNGRFYNFCKGVVAEPKLSQHGGAMYIYYQLWPA